MLRLTDEITSGGGAGPLNFNSIVVENQHATTGGAGSFGLTTAFSAALNITVTEGGSNIRGFQTGLYTRLNHTLGASNIGIADHIVAVFVGVSNQNANGKGLYGIEPLVIAASGASHGHLVAANPNASLSTGADVEYRTGVRVQTSGDKRASISDTAISIVAGFGDPGSSWQNGITLNDYGGSQSIAEDGDFLRSNSAITLANVFNLSNFNVTGNIIDTPNFRISGAGEITSTGTAWTAYTPTVTAGGGAWGSGTAAGFYKRLGKTVFLRVVYTVLDVGGATTSVIFTLPGGMTSFAGRQFIGGIEAFNNGKMMRGFLNVSSLSLQGKYYDNTFAPANGDIYVFQGVIEIQ